MPQKCAKVRFATSEHGLLLGDVAIIAAKYSEQTWIIIMLVEISFVFIITTHREYISSNNGYSSYEIALKLLWLVASALAVLVRQGSHKGQGKRYYVWNDRLSKSECSSRFWVACAAVNRAVRWFWGTHFETPWVTPVVPCCNSLIISYYIYH